MKTVFKFAILFLILFNNSGVLAQKKLDYYLDQLSYESVNELNMLSQIYCDCIEENQDTLSFHINEAIIILDKAKKSEIVIKYKFLQNYTSAVFVLPRCIAANLQASQKIDVLHHRYKFEDEFSKFLDGEKDEMDSARKFYEILVLLIERKCNNNFEIAKNYFLLLLELPEYENTNSKK